MQEGWIQTPRSIDEIVFVLSSSESKILFSKPRNASDVHQFVPHLYFLRCRMSMLGFATQEDKQ